MGGCELDNVRRLVLNNLQDGRYLAVGRFVVDEDAPPGD
jgi:hypothetical protein